MSEPTPARYRSPAELVARLVCPHCKTEVTHYLVTCDGHRFTVTRCRDHGDVVPMLSHVSNEVF